VYIIATLADLPEADAAAQRLLKNQTDIGNAIKPFYGDQAGDQLTSLLREHILIAADLLNAAKSGDAAKFEEANTRWYDNASQIAIFLSSANPDNWPLADMQAMMNSHLDLTLEEATARLNGDICFRMGSSNSSPRNSLTRRHPSRRLTLPWRWTSFGRITSPGHACIS
jgi:hypothetical protein